MVQDGDFMMQSASVLSNNMQKVTAQLGICPIITSDITAEEMGDVRLPGAGGI